MGDAPPYEPGFKEDKSSAKRWYETDHLVDLANKRNIKIHCILCKSREKERLAFEKSLDRTQQFMGRLSSETGGLMLDTSYSEVQEKLAEIANRSRAEYTRVGMIKETEINSIREDLAKKAKEANDTGVKRIAVLPLFEFDQMKFDYGSLEVQLSTELRRYFRQSSDLRITKPREVQKAIDRMRFDDIQTDDWLTALCINLRVDYIVYGSIPAKKSSASTTATVYVHEQKAGNLAVKITATSKEADLGKTIVRQLASAVGATAGYLPLKNRLSQLAKEQDFQVAGDGLLDLTDSERSQLFAAIEAIEQAIDYESGNPEGTKVLMDAEEKLSAILQSKPKQPFVYSMLASCKFNLAKSLQSVGEEDAGKKKFDECIDAIKESYLLNKESNLLKGNLFDPSQLEIAADYNLLVRKDYSAAVKFYEQITKHNQTSPIHHALRAHWMLAGIRSGDWETAEAAPNEVDPKAARNHLVVILVHWPESSEANSIKRNLRWNEKNGNSQTPYFPLEGNLLTQE